MLGAIAAVIVGLMSMADLYLTITAYETGGFREVNPLWRPFLRDGAYGMLIVMKCLITVFFCVVVVVAWPHVMAVGAVALAILSYLVVLYRHWQWLEIIDRVRWSSDAELIALDMMNLPRGERLRALEELRKHNPQLYHEVRKVVEEVKGEMEEGQ